MPQPESALSSGLGISYSTMALGNPSRPETESSSRAVREKASAPDLRNRSTPSDKLPRRPTFKRDGAAQGYSSFSVLQPPATSSSSAIRGLPKTKEQAFKRRTDTSSLASGSSIGSSLRNARSAELFRKFVKSNELGGARYVPLSGAEGDDPSFIIGAAVMSQTSSQMSSAFEEIRSVQVDLQYAPPTRTGSRATQESQQSDLPSRLHTRMPSGRPLPIEPLPAVPQQEISPTRRKRQSTITQRSFDEHPSRPPLKPIRTDTTSSDTTDRIPNPDSMSRSLSSPGPNQQPAKPLFSYPDGLDDPPEAVRPNLHNKRLSNISTGVHSKNAVILSAESGGLMLEYSPGGKWKEGQMICGTGVGLLGTPESISNATNDDHEDIVMDQVRPRSRERAQSRLSETNMQTQSGYLRHSKIHSDNDALLARHGTLLHPASSHDRTSDELGIMLGKKNRKPSRDKLLPAPEHVWQDDAAASIRLEASKKKRARVEVDVVLERDCVVEGGEVRGRLEVRVNGTKRSEGLRIGGGKIRVVGFEETSSSHRHIFYHHPHPLPQFASGFSIAPSSCSLFASEPDTDGYRLASEGSHSLPFRLRLPLDGGAKGTFIGSSKKEPSIRYVVVGSVKLYLPAASKRSIAHFYRPISVLPYLKASAMLAPSVESIEASTENGLGWSLNGEKGKVDLRVSMGRRTWVCGQKLWCEVAIHNESSKRIKNIQLALLQTVQTFVPQPTLDPSGRMRPVISKRKSTDRDALLGRQDQRDMDLDACRTNTQRRKVSEEVLESDFASSGTGRVTGKGWWTGVEAGESGHWDLSLAIPPNLVTIRRIRLIEVQYTLRVTVSGSIFVDIPVNLIDFLSIDPPPMPGDAPRLILPQKISTQVALQREDSMGLPMNQKGAFYPLNGPSVVCEEPDEIATTPSESIISELLGGALVGRRSTRRAPKTERPMSIASDHDDGLDDDPAPLLPRTTERISRPNAMRLLSYLSSPNSGSDESGIPSSENISEGDDEAFLAARRAQGRARSLAALERAGLRAAADDEHKAAMYKEKAEGHSPNEEFKPLNTPSEEVYRLVNDTPEGSSDLHRTPRALNTAEMAREMGASTPLTVDDGPGLRDLPHRNNIPHVVAEADDDVGDETVLEDLVLGHGDDEAGQDDGDWIDESEEEEEEGNDSRPRIRAAPHPRSTATLTPSDEQDDPLIPSRTDPATSLATANPAIDAQLAFMTGTLPHTRDKYGTGHRSVQGSLATTNTSDEDSEVGQVLKAKKQVVESPSQATIVRSPTTRTHLLSISRDDRALRDEPVPPKTMEAQESYFFPPREPGLATSSGERNRVPRPVTTRLRIPKHGAAQNDEVPELTPSVESDTGSSEEHVALESPRLPQFRDSFSQRSLPQVPSEFTGPPPFFAGMNGTPAQSLWQPAGSLLRNQADRLRGSTPSTSFLPTSPPTPSENHDSPSSHNDDNSSNSHETATTGQTHRSLLPSVRSKIAQLEGRQEALRKMSLASFGTPAASPRPGDEPTNGFMTPKLRSRTPAPVQPSPGSSFSRPLRARTLGAEPSSSVESPHRLRRGTIATVTPTLSAEDASRFNGGLPHPDTVEDSSSEPEVYQVNSQLGRDAHDADDEPSPTSPTSTPLPAHPVTATRSVLAKSKRKSYTAALAPRPARTTSDDTGLHRPEDQVYMQRVVVSPTSGHPIVMPSVSEGGHGSPRTSPIVPPSPQRPHIVRPGSGASLHHARTLPERPASYTPAPRPNSSTNHLNRDKSTSSTSTTATQIEEALIARSVQLPRRQTRARTVYVEGKYGAEKHTYDYQPYTSSPAYGTPVAGGVAHGQDVQKFRSGDSNGGGYLHGNYHDPYQASGPASPTWVRPADRQDEGLEGGDETHWENFY